MIRTRIIQTAAELESVRDRWEQLAREATIFQSFAWNRLAASCFSRRERPYVICCESDSGAAIIPAVIRRDGTTGLMGKRLFDYRDILYAGDEAVLPQAWRRLCDLNRPFQLTALRGERSRWLWREAQPRPFAHAPCVRLNDLPGMMAADGVLPTSSRDRFLAMHARLGRHTARMVKQAIAFRQRAGSERELVRFIFEAKGRQATPSTNLFQDRMRQAFMVQIAAQKESRCEVYTYETTSKLVAALVAFRDDAVRHCYTIYYNSRWSGFSPGQLLLFEVAARSLAEGLNCDFMTGEYPYKNRLATSRVPLFTVEAGAEALPAIFPFAEVDAAAKSKRDGSRPAA